MAPDIKGKIVFENQASPVIDKVKKDIAGLDKAAGTATGGLSGLAKVAGAAGLLALGAQAASATIELAKLGSASIAMKASFEQMAGGAENAASILDALTTASRGTISQYDLMLTANRSMLLGVADSAEEFSQLMQIATVRGRAMGLSTTQAFNDIVTGLGRESKLILDNLGILIDLEKAHQDYATSIGKTAAQLTDAERKQALINQVIASSADLLKDANSNAKALAGEGYAQLATAWTDFRTLLGESLAPIFDDLAKQVASGLSGISGAIDDWRYEDTTVFGPQLANQQVEDAKRQLADLQKELVDYTQNASSKLLDWADILGLDENDPAVLARYQDGLNAIVADIRQVQTELDKLTGAQERAAAESAKAIASRSNLGALSDATRPDVSADLALGATQQQIRAALELYRDASASLTEANRQGNAAAADVANGYMTNLVPVIRQLITDYNALAEAQGKQRIVGVSYGNADIIYQTAEALQAEKKAAEDLATALEIVGESDGKLQGLYDTLLDSGNIEGAAAAFESIKGVITDITAEWVAQGKTADEISSTLLPKLIAELDGVIAAQVEAGAAGVDAGALISSGFLSAIPGIEAVIGTVNRLLGVTVAASSAVQGFSLNSWQWKEFGATGVRPSGLIGPAPKGVETPVSRGPQPLDNSGFGWFGAAADTFGGKTAADLQSERIRALAQNQRNLASAALSGGSGGGGGSIDNEAQKLANRLTSILNGALKSGINLDEILGRQDAIEEPARRLADIAVRGFESPWVDYIRNTFPEIWGEIESAGDPKAAAASILRDFEDGLRPELLDKGRAKELVKRALLGEQNTAALAAEIAGELASELGVSLEQAQQAAAGVLGTGTGDGTDTGMNGGVVAAAFTDDFVGTMGTMLARFEGVGGQAGASFQVGFLATTAQMPAAILANLASLLLPMLTAALAGQGTRTGAS